MLRADQEHIVGRPFPDRLEQPGDEFDEAVGLFELFVLLEQGDDVLEPRVERVGRGDLVGDRFGAPVGRLRLGGLIQFAAERLGDVGDLRLVGPDCLEAIASRARSQDRNRRREPIGRASTSPARCTSCFEMNEATSQTAM
ncbi:MAG: hypothetical protein MUF25_17775 [Pirellulaceae bacterium]|jgi:hypothetical protein|nr:hypothetical protein [Pirellulaceae bacterium]